MSGSVEAPPILPLNNTYAINPANYRLVVPAGLAVYDSTLGAGVSSVRPVAAAVLVGGLSIAFAATAAAAPAAGRGDQVAAGSVAALSAAVTVTIREPAAGLVSFWTSRRLASAAPLALPAGAAGRAGSGARPALPASGPAAASAPPTTPWPRRGTSARPVPPGEKSRLWGKDTGVPATTIGQLYFRITRHSVAVCTATIITAANKDTIWTAGHCVSNGKGHWYSSFLFIPGRHADADPYGSFGVARVSAPKGWVDHGLSQYDMAALALAPNHGGTAQQQAGSQGWHFGGSRFAWPGLRIFGYPANIFPPLRAANREELRYCTGSTGRDAALHMMEFRCNMGHGSSGGPLIWDMKNGLGYVIGNVSIGENGSYDRWSPQLGLAALHVYDAVDRVRGPRRRSAPPLAPAANRACGRTRSSRPGRSC
jgi:V8-like Glu-specific endopeptidase